MPIPHPGRKSVPAVALVALFALLLPLGSAARAQYLYLDANGDGLHTEADVIHPAGPTRFDVWLATDVDRDGLPGVCTTGDGELTLSGYEFILRAANGTVSWDGYTNLRAELDVPMGEAADATDFRVGFGGGNLPAGTYRLGTLAVVVQSGTPSLAFATSSPLGPLFMTAFVSQCSGTDFDNTLKLGTDWFDADGASYGGVANRAPSFDPPASLAMDEGATHVEPLAAEDADGDPVTFALVAGPPFAGVTTTDSGPGVAAGTLSLSPGYADSGSYALSLSASDGLLTTTREAALRVRNVNRGPIFNVVPMVMVPEGRDMEFQVSVVDPDDDGLALDVRSGPSYMTMRVTISDYGSLSAVLRFQPGYFDAGMTTARLVATDGEAETELLVDIMIRNVDRPPVLTAPSSVAAVEGEPVVFTVSAADEDFEYAAFTASGLPAGAAFVDGMNNRATFRWLPRYDQAGLYAVTVRADDGAGGTDEATVEISVADATHPIALAQPFDVMLGEGDAAEQPLYAYDEGGDPIAFTLAAGPAYASVATIDAGAGYATGVVRLAPGFEDAGTTAVTVRASDGVLTVERTFLATVHDQPPGPSPSGPPFAPPFPTLPTAQTPHTVTVADVDRDGRPDLVVCNLGSNAVSVFRALGDGTYDMRRDYPTANRPHTVVVRDLNRDGIPDLAISNIGANSVSSVLGRGDGTFGDRRDFPLGGSPVFAGVDDFDRDGIPDIVSTNQNLGALMFLRGVGDGTFAEAVPYPADAGSHGLAIADWNADGNPDVAIANDAAHTVSIHLGRGDGTFAPAVRLHVGEPHTVAAGDVNGDGRLDLVLANYHEGTVTLCLGHGDGSFTEGATLETGADAHASAVADLDGDGIADLVVANQGAATASFFMGLGGGAFAPKVDFAVAPGAHSIAIADLDGDGTPDVAISGIFGNRVTLLRNRGVVSVSARAFPGPQDETLLLRSAKPTWTLYVEGDAAEGAGAGAGFDPAAVLPGSVRLESPGTGSVGFIEAIPGKGTVIADHDGNGAPEFAATFARGDLRALFAEIRGRQVIPVAVTGALEGGRRFRAALPLSVIGGGPPGPTVRVAPNPLNPSGTVVFSTRTPGAARVVVVDVQGRRVATLMDERLLPEGEHRLSLRADRRLASGIYFLRVETADGVRSVRFAVLK